MKQVHAFVLYNRSEVGKLRNAKDKSAAREHV